MITPSDLAYRQTKQIKVSGAPLLSPYRELAEWINAHYGVHVLNIVLDTIEPDSRPRLNVILEWAEDQRKFLQKERPNFDKDAQLSVQQQFASLKGTLGDQSIHVSRLLVIFSAFEPVARAEANNHITTHEIATLKSTIGDKELWEIRKCFDTVTFFYYTDAQLRANEAKGMRDVYVREYSRLTQPYDQFGYLQRRGIVVRLDSKENFDTNYDSNWFYNDKDH